MVGKDRRLLGQAAAGLVQHQHRTTAQDVAAQNIALLGHLAGVHQPDLRRVVDTCQPTLPPFGI